MLSPAAWAKKDVPKICGMLKAICSDQGIIKQNVDLHMIQPLAIQAGQDGGDLRNFKEVWNAENCKTSLSSAGMYEASGSMFWLNALDADPHPEIPSARVTWSQIAAAYDAWSPATLAGSHADMEWQRFEFHGAFVTCLSTPQGGVGLSSNYCNMPMLCGHAMVWSWFWRVGEVCLQMKKDGITPEMKRQLKKLVEAALTMTIRMRLTACKDFTEDMLRASIRWSEAVRMRFTVSADTFLDLVDKVLAIPGLDFSTALKLEKGFGYVWHHISEYAYCQEQVYGNFVTEAIRKGCEICIPVAGRAHPWFQP